jgi:rfaE bifunctional protein kinase chain/domain
MKRSDIEVLLADIRGARVAVVGDYCLDAYWDLDTSLSEISIETGLATKAVRHQRYSPGGAGNVTANLVAMGVRQVEAVGVLGDDPFGRELLRLLQGEGTGIGGIAIQDHDWATPVYIKPFENGKEQGRIDLGGANRLDSTVSTNLLAALRQRLSALDVVIINQQLPRGIHTEELRAGLRALISQARIPFIVDSRMFSDSFDGAIRKVNDREALRLCGTPWDTDGPVPHQIVARSARALFERWSRPVFITRGPRGILGRCADGVFEVPGLEILGPVDTVGAGDSALAGIAAALAAGRGCAEAAMLGNFAAGVTVRKLSMTGTASPQEILAIGTDPDYLMRPETAEDPRAARYQPGTEMEIVTELPPNRPARHVVFDFDGTISTLRTGWEKIMESVMVRDLAPGEDQRRAAQLVRGYIHATTGTQTIAQMQGLAEMMKEQGLVPEARTGDPGAYRVEYDRELRAMVSARLERLQRGELAPGDFMIKGVLPFLEALFKAGVELSLASGTQESDVVREAAILEVARFFDGRIFGSVGDPKVEAKKVVLQRITAAAVEPHGLFTFGDGPREIRETKKVGGYAVGVASDEHGRSGWNMAKRSRLIQAGADMVIADFLQGEMILKMMGIRP